VEAQKTIEMSLILADQFTDRAALIADQGHSVVVAAEAMGSLQTTG
jgi:hypothetical protein